MEGDRPSNGSCGENTKPDLVCGNNQEPLEGKDGPGQEITFEINPSSLLFHNMQVDIADDLTPRLIFSLVCEILMLSLTQTKN